jgi:CO dehydrogenase nickel-insertion accessory protein CooC1
LPEKFVLTKNGLRLMVLGAIRVAGGGYACPEQTVLRRLLNYLILTAKEVVILDMEAGVEHFGRATLTLIDVILVVVQCPCSKSISKYGAHNQRGVVSIQVRTKGFIWLEKSLMKNTLLNEPMKT